MIFKLSIYIISSLIIAIMRSKKFEESKRSKHLLAYFVSYTLFLIIFDFLFFSVNKLAGAGFILLSLIPFLFLEMKKSASKSKF